MLGNMFTRKEILRAGYETKEGKGILRIGYGNKNFSFLPVLYKILKYRSIIRMNIDLMEFILEIIFLKK